MTSSFQGMDTEVARATAASLRTNAVSLQQSLTAIQRLVEAALAAWDGPDAHQFAQWWSEHRAGLAAAQQSVEGLATSLSNNADEQERASGEHGGGSGSALGASGAGARTFGPRDYLEPLWTADLASTFADYLEVGKVLDLADVPGGNYLGAVMKGIGLGTAASELVDSAQHGDVMGAGLAGVDVGLALAKPTPVGLLWSGLQNMTSFFIPMNYHDQDTHMDWMRTERGFTDADIAERYTGWQGFIDLGNDNAARQAPWLVEGADRLMEKPAEWLYNAGIKL